MARSSIEWTDETWNPIEGCQEVSPGCAHCYARTFAERFRGVAGHAFEHGFDPQLAPHKLDQPLRWTKPRTVFVNSMSDLFYEDIPDAYIEDVARVMLTANWNIYQVLTKRSDRLREMLTTNLREAAQAKHILWGVSVENRRHGVPRIDDLRNSGAARTFLSVEPLLEDLGHVDLSGIDWVIAGGESGHGARAMQPQWAAAIRDLCKQSRIPFFFKQVGGKQKWKTGRRLEGRLHNAKPRMQRNPIATQSIRRSMRDALRSRMEHWLGYRASADTSPSAQRIPLPLILPSPGVADNQQENL